MRNISRRIFEADEMFAVKATEPVAKAFVEFWQSHTSPNFSFDAKANRFIVTPVKRTADRSRLESFFDLAD